jgi:tRNA U34 2-thiouridine synthase MnmA/TrmU
MSGGVDSTAALIILKKNGWNPIGLSLKFPNGKKKKVKEQKEKAEKKIYRAHQLLLRERKNM